MRRYIHAKIGEEIRAIGGAYTVLREERFPWRGREVLVVIGAARFDTSCCGVGGCGYAQAQGYVVEDLRTENALLVEPIAPPSCAACLGGPIDTFGRTHGNEVVVSTTNRNFIGRMGSKDSQIYLASPYTAAATAVTGHITDPRDL